MDVLKLLRESDDEFQKAKARDIALWQKLHHNKSDLEMFLNNNITQLHFKTKDGKDAEIICTSNMTLVKLMSTKKKADKQKVIHEASNGIKTRESTTVTTWDLIENKMKTVYLGSWQIIDFITIRPENIEKLDMCVSEILKK